MKNQMVPVSVLALATIISIATAVAFDSKGIRPALDEISRNTPEIGNMLRECSGPRARNDEFVSEACNICERNGNIRFTTEHGFAAACGGQYTGIFITAIERWDMNKGNFVEYTVANPKKGFKEKIVYNL